MADTKPQQKEDKLTTILKSLASERQKPLLLLGIDHVIPPAVAVLNQKLKDKAFEELDVVLHTPGGHIESAFKIVKLLRKHAKAINIIVPSYAKSAGTLICLCADKMILTTTSELGPLDVQMPEHQEGDVDTYKSALNGYKALEQIQKHAVENMDVATMLILRRTGNKIRLFDAIKLAIEFSGNTSGCLYNQIHPKTISENARSLEIGERYGIKILEKYMGWENKKAVAVVRKLVYDYPSHEFIIDSEELKELGFVVEEPQGTEVGLIEALGLILDVAENEDGHRIELIEPSIPTPAKLATMKAQKATSEKKS